MLERASACLDSGVRLSLRAQRRAPKSRRLLHSNFWHHAAGDIDLPTCLTSSTCPPRPPPQEITSLQQPTTPSDGPFLDFLYPPHALAFMSRASTTHLDGIWDIRAAHRASAHGLRGYSTATPTSTAIPSPRAQPDEQSLVDDEHTSEPRRTRSDLQPSAPSFQTPHDQLSDLLSRPPGSNVVVQRAWGLYAISTHEDQHNPDLVTTLLIWLHKWPNYASNRRILDLFARLHSQDRSAPTYAVAVAAYLATGRVQDAMALHIDASNSLSGSGHLLGADSLMLYAVRHQDWDMALDVCRRISVKHMLQSPADLSTPSAKSPIGLWTKLVNAAKLDSNLLSLAERYKSTQDGSARAELLELFESIWHILVRFTLHSPKLFTPAARAPSPRAFLRRIFYDVHKLALPSSLIYEDCLLQLARLSGNASVNDLSSIISFVYTHYRLSPAFHPTQGLLSHLLDVWRDERLAFYITGKDRRRSHKTLTTYIHDIEEHHGRLADSNFVTIMDCYARLGDVKDVEDYARRYSSLYDERLENSAKLWPLVYVHAKRANPVDATNQLHRIKPDFGVDPDLRCWNIVIHAYEEANDLEGAVDTLNALLETNLKPDAFTFTPVMNLYAKKGDVDGTSHLLQVAEARDIRSNTHMLNSLIVAHVNNDDLENAQQCLESTIEAVREGKAAGPLTMCFNTILTAHALGRDIESAMKTYQRMKDEKIPLDANTYGALAQALCMFRQTNAAHQIVRSVMRKNKTRPLAFHYTIVMAGYVNQHMYQAALDVFDEMSRAKVRPSKSTRSVYLKAKTLREHHGDARGGDLKYDNMTTSAPLADAIEDFKRLAGIHIMPPPGNQPEPGLRGRSPVTSLDPAFLVFIHGKRRAFEAVEQILATSMPDLSDSGDISKDAPSLELLSAVMSVHFRARDYAEVEKYWKLILSHADYLRASHAERVAELPDVVSFSHGIDAGMIVKGIEPADRKIPPAHRFMLSRPLRFYLASQFSQKTLTASITMTDLISSLLSSGFQFDNRTWNAYIVHLCRCSPPRALLAFSLAEKFLIPNWPGWVKAKSGMVSNRYFGPKKSQRAEDVEYMRNGPGTRYRAHGDLVPQYKTMVYLASALLDLRTREAAGANTISGQGAASAVQQQVGSLREIKEKAPETLNAVQLMPKVNDRLQTKLVRR
ncbi:hypothetical protein BDV97DRAFT_45199 [Delphinella strobiligena]|nr:hypothetical protein BDV97DRAFT_45199 [Delphinella strobiligena]